MFEFLVLTAVRSAEARWTRWSEIDVDRAMWTLPPDRVKTRIEHRVPLSTRALAVLEEARTSATLEAVRLRTTLPTPCFRALGVLRVPAVPWVGTFRGLVACTLRRLSPSLEMAALYFFFPTRMSSTSDRIGIAFSVTSHSFGSGSFLIS